jgi:superfamily II DNA or RNA helicase
MGNLAQVLGQGAGVPTAGSVIAIEAGARLEGDHSPLRALDGVRPLYVLPREPFAEEILIPGFAAAEQVDCMVGFFSSAILAQLAPGLATYLQRPSHKFRLVISPVLSPEDQKAIEDGLKSIGQVMTEMMEQAFVTVDLLERHTLKCLSHLLQRGQIEIKIAVMEDALFHPKVWLFHSGTDIVAAHGSSNVTYAGIRKNVEQVAVSKSWSDATQRFTTDKLADEFAALWANRREYCIVVPMPDALREKMLRAYAGEPAPTEDELRDLYARAKELMEPPQEPYEGFSPPRTEFRIPDGLRYTDGPFQHQGQAVEAWCAAGFHGVLEMATGSGKTITSMIAAHRLFEHNKPLLIVVAAPYVPLVEQWCNEIEPFGLRPVNLTNVGGAQKRAAELQKIRRKLRSGLSEAEAVVVSHDTLCSPEFAEAIRSFDCARMLIADEAHNLGRGSFVNDPPEFFEYRLALSATPIRQYDPEGTDSLFDYFGPVVFSFPLERAIGRCLVEYDYYVHFIDLTPSEMDDWYELTAKIKQNAWRSNNGKPDDYMAKLLRDRRALLETASGKLGVLSSLIDRDLNREFKHTLVYATDKAPEQLEQVNRMLREKGILFHQLTAEETANRAQTRQIIRSFQDGEIQVLTAKRVLDEGVNIPQICRAYILASTTVERQWVQRRGRLLRTCKDINKTFSIIHDFLALPPNLAGDLDDDAKSLVRAELKRAQEFARLARNAGRPDGPLGPLDRLVDVAFG